MNIYIGNLNYSVKEEQLEDLLSQYGTVTSVRVIKDRETGRSKGFGFCEIEEEDGASKAIEELNGTDFENRTMVIKKAIPRR